MHNKILTNSKGFTLIELVMVIILLSVLAAVAIPSFIDFRVDAKNASTHGALGAIRSAVAISTAAIQLKEDPSIPTPKYPTLLEIEQNAFNASHPNLNGNSLLDPSTGFPKNPWTISTFNGAFSTIRNCNPFNKSDMPPAARGIARAGWCYKQTSGEVWTNSDLNGAGAGKTENYY